MKTNAQPHGRTGYTLTLHRQSKVCKHRSARIYTKGSNILVELEGAFIVTQISPRTFNTAQRHVIEFISKGEQQA